MLIKQFFYTILLVFFMSCSINSGFHVYDLDGNKVNFSKSRYSNFNIIKLYFDRESIEVPYKEVKIIESDRHFYGDFYFDKVFMNTLNKKVSLLDVDALIFEKDLSNYSFYKKDNLYFTAIKFK